MRDVHAAKALAIVLGFASIANVCCADRLIDIPTARKLAYGTIRYENRFEPGSQGSEENLLGIGISTSFDTEIRTIQESMSGTRSTFDLAYNVVAPIPGLSPGFSFGVKDGVDQTLDGRRFFGVVTFREPFDTANGEFPADISIGLFAAKRWSPFVGVEIPFSKQIHLLAEHNGNRISAGGEYRIVPWLNLRAQVSGQKSLLSVQATMHF